MLFLCVVFFGVFLGNRLPLWWGPTSSLESGSLCLGSSPIMWCLWDLGLNVHFFEKCETQIVAEDLNCFALNWYTEFSYLYLNHTQKIVRFLPACFTLCLASQLPSVCAHACTRVHVRTDTHCLILKPVGNSFLIQVNIFISFSAVTFYDLPFFRLLGWSYIFCGSAVRLERQYPMGKWMAIFSCVDCWQFDCCEWSQGRSSWFPLCPLLSG